MDEKSIKQRKRPGDWRLTAEVLGKTIEACRQAYYHKEGRAYETVRDTLIKVIEAREALVRQLKED